MTDLFSMKHHEPKYNAQRNLAGRTHYADDETLRFFQARILSARPSPDGLLFALVESLPKEGRNTRRVFRFVVFDVFGTVIERADLEHALATSDKARAACDAFLATVDARAITLEGIAHAERSHKRDMDAISATLDRLTLGKAV